MSNFWYHARKVGHKQRVTLLSDNDGGRGLCRREYSPLLFWTVSLTVLSRIPTLMRRLQIKATSPAPLEAGWHPSVWNTGNSALNAQRRLFLWNICTIPDAENCLFPIDKKVKRI